MTQPQDKMRAEFEAAMHGLDLIADSEGRYFRTSTKAAWEAWQAACAQQSAQSQQDSIDAARWNYAMDWDQKEFAVCKREGMSWTPIKTSGPLDHHISTQGASNV